MKMKELSGKQKYELRKLFEKKIEIATEKEEAELLTSATGIPISKVANDLDLSRQYVSMMFSRKYPRNKALIEYYKKLGYELKE